MDAFEPLTFEYRSTNASAACALAQWEFTTYTDCQSLVLPDGCRDVIVTRSSTGSIECIVSDLDDQAYQVQSAKGMHIKGIRLRPGTSIDEQKLKKWLNANDATNSLFTTDYLDEFCTRSNNISDALASLATTHQTIASAASELGLSVRSLQRLVKSHTGVSPYFWLSLARARTAAKNTLDNTSLSEVAFQSGYADQAHMSRELKRWFKHTPRQIINSDACHELFSEAGYC